MMSCYEELNQLCMEKLASPDSQYAVRTHRNYRNGLDEKFMIGSDSIWSDEARNIIKKRAPQTSVNKMLKSSGATNNHYLTYKLRSNLAEPQTDFSPSASPQENREPLGDRIRAWNNQMIEQKNQKKQNQNTSAVNINKTDNISSTDASQTQPTNTDNTSLVGKIKQWGENRAEAKQERLTQKRQERQRIDNQRIDKENRLQQALKNPSFRPDTVDPKAQDQSFWAAVKGNVPQGGDKNQAITEKTSVFANPNNQSSLGARMLSWGKNNPGKAALGAGLTAAGVAAAAYGAHKLNQSKKKKQEEQSREQQPYNGMYRAASEYLDAICIEKLAASEVEDVAASIPRGVQDDASAIEKIQEVVKHTKKEDVPGGKSAPSRLVQRKNKERFRK